MVIAHRPSALESVDLICVMSQGRLQHPVGPKDLVLSKVLQRPTTPPRPLKVVPEIGGGPA